MVMLMYELTLAQVNSNGSPDLPSPKAGTTSWDGISATCSGQSNIEIDTGVFDSNRGAGASNAPVTSIHNSHSWCKQR
jgi:hypothetical protein